MDSDAQRASGCWKKCLERRQQQRQAIEREGAGVLIRVEDTEREANDHSSTWPEPICCRLSKY